VEHAVAWQQIIGAMFAQNELFFARQIINLGIVQRGNLDDPSYYA
jgi:hypothetical protein